MTDAGNLTVTVFSIDSSTGALTQLPGQTVSMGGNPGPLFTATAIDPKDRFFYIGGPSYAFSGFSLADTASGNLPVLPGMPVQVTPMEDDNRGSTSMAVDPSGTFLFGNENDYTSAFSCCFPDLLVELRIDPKTGGLTQVSSSTATLVGSASKIVVAPPH
jgi:hypothetical protein